MNKLRRCWNFFFGFNGRISRLHFAIFLPFLVITFMAINFLFFIFSKAITPLSIQRSSTSEIILVIAILIIAVVFYLLLKYSHIARRVHDYNKDFWGSKLSSTIVVFEVIATIVSLNGKSEFALLSVYLMGIIGLICLISLAFIKGTEGENNFGPKPVPFWKKNNSTQQQ